MSRCVYTLTDSEVALMTDLAQRRQKIKEQHGVASRKWDATKSDLTAHILACEAEYAVSQLLAVAMDYTVSPHGNRRGWKLLIPPDYTVDVHYRADRRWDLGWKTDKPEQIKADATVLVYPGFISDPPHSYEAHGWLPKRRWKTLAEIADFGYGPRLIVPHYKLLPMASLIAIAETNARLEALKDALAREAMITR